MSASLVGSEMCIRDRCAAVLGAVRQLLGTSGLRPSVPEAARKRQQPPEAASKHLVLPEAVSGRLKP
eukprot:11295032-Alexandrium_andersonii.AAC.1